MGVSKAVVPVVLILVGVATILGGLGLANQGRLQMALADEWEPPAEEPCTIPADALPDDYTDRSIVERHHVVEELRGEHCPDTGSPENPYDGGGGKVGVGLLVALLGSGFVYWGTR